MSIVTTRKYRTELTKLFVDDVSINDYYLFVSSVGTVENDIPLGLDVFNTNTSKNEFLEKTIFGKKIDAESVIYMIRNNPWVVNTVYAQYDDADDISDKNYYAVVYPDDTATGRYRIYKCLFNNYGAESITPPNYSDDTPDQLYELADGYIWKHLYSISVVDFEKYVTRGYIPIIEAAEVSANTANSSNTDTVSAAVDLVECEISQIFVENQISNQGYEKVSGVIDEINTTSGVIKIIATTSLASPTEGEPDITVKAPGEFNKIANYYSGYSFYVTTDVGSQVYEIKNTTYDPDTGTTFITLEEGVPDDGVLIEQATFRILPRVEIRGDGSGAVALPRVSDEGTITKIDLINKGSGYTNAVASIPNPFAFDPDTLSSLDKAAVLRVVLSPRGGHGSNLVDELSCRHALVYINMTEGDNQVAPTTNTFGAVGIVRNPEFKVFPVPDIFDNRLELTVSTNNLQVDDIVTQVENVDTDSEFFNEVRFAGKVHEVGANTVFLCEYMGPYPRDFVPDANSSYANTDFSDISLNPELPILSPTDQIININTDNGFTTSQYIQRTGEVFYMNGIFPITRTSISREQFKILLEF